ncbi:uncharacterized protein LOC131929585 [Physella acuta]|uniref:uncharacterized protein LOC131929585 n=1 Tax=Physella acuta TaxID=109671 RepID=UPI0027DE039E|nr:uncharacterized protein LOC131929585 [Physella acuta]XP_059141850.1 uncharacterized protein LOC131929585 [Physella acuta]
MFGLSKKSNKPTTFYALAFCIHVVAFILMAIGMFTPYWTEITEQVGTSTTNSKYDRGLILSCSPSKSCEANINFTSASKVFFTSFVLGIISIVIGFFTLQLFCAGLFIRSCRESNLGVPVAVMSIFEGAMLILVLVFFEISIGLDTNSGNIHRDDTFGFSRGLIIGSIVLYWVSSFFIIGEYFRRFTNDRAPVQEVKPARGPPPRSHREDYDRGRRNKKPLGPAVVSAAAPPPYTKANPVYDPNDGQRRGMNACNKPGCQMCNYVAESPTFWGPAGVFNITETLDCQHVNVVYAIICMKDEKVFIGHSRLKLEDAFRVHLANVRANNNSDPVAFHFTRPGHNIQDIRISALASINCDKDTRARLEKALSYNMDQPHNSYYGINEDFEFL